ncbi:MAG: homoserine kinase [Trueperaceae bacterium]|nr:homoserine kinase [Trueperaceae bacterium]
MTPASSADVTDPATLTPLTVRVPATSANLGPGFDCLGLAVGLYLEVTAYPDERDRFVYRGEGRILDTPDNLIHLGFRQMYALCGVAAPAVRFEVDNPIPLARGLGSSSAALVAGAALAWGWLEPSLSNSPYNPPERDAVFQLTAQHEGHPDNVAPAIYGGFTVSALHDGRYLCQTLDIPARWRLLFAVPAFELSTAKARAVLPATYPRHDVIFNTSRSGLWTAAVALDKPDLLFVAAQDSVHEPYREPLVPGLRACRTALAEAGAAAAYLSGAGPTLAAVTVGDEATEACRAVMQTFVGEEGRVLELSPSAGYTLSRA